MSEGADERYAEFAPPVSLRPWVRKIWTYASDRPSRTVQRIAPDGCPELILHVDAPYEEQDEGGVFRLQPRCLFAGQMTRPLGIRPVGAVELVAVRFEPDGAREWLGMPAVYATDQRLDVVDRMVGLALAAGDPEQQARVMGEWLEHQRREDWSIDPQVRAEIAVVETTRDGTDRSPAEQRALQRRFLDRVGVSPRMLRSILRFRRVFDHVSEGRTESTGWLEAGLQAGYFDQPQMARDFRRFLGCTATQWARDQVELARRIASQSYNRGPVPSR